MKTLTKNEIEQKIKWFGCLKEVHTIEDTIQIVVFYEKDIDTGVYTDTIMYCVCYNGNILNESFREMSVALAFSSQIIASKGKDSNSNYSYKFVDSFLKTELEEQLEKQANEIKRLRNLIVEKENKQ